MSTINRIYNTVISGNDVRMLKFDAALKHSPVRVFVKSKNLCNFF